MNSILSGLLAAIISFVFNKHVVSKLGNRAIIYLIPSGEELFKTSAYYFIGGNLIIVHLIFGVIEAGFDFSSNKLAALFAIITHLSFGGLTFYCWQLTKNILLSLLITIIAHLCWNYSVGRLVQCD